MGPFVLVGRVQGPRSIPRTRSSHSGDHDEKERGTVALAGDQLSHFSFRVGDESP